METPQEGGTRRIRDAAPSQSPFAAPTRQLTIAFAFPAGVSMLPRPRARTLPPADRTSMIVHGS